MISSKIDLQLWLASIGINKPLNELPDVRPLRKSKWVDVENEWSYEEVYYEVGMNTYLDREAIGGRIRCMLDVMCQGSTVRVALVRATTGTKFYTRISSIPHVEITKSQLNACTSTEDLVKVINNLKQLEYKLKAVGEK